ncbi:hypothetical protein GJ496_000296 [Pomphorhynchus laevis]|nr:hypothetical protein GJ496_000296 [Pomphorhynchus laevis]
MGAWKASVEIMFISDSFSFLPFANLHLYEVVYVLRLYDPLMAACTNENLGKKDTKMTSPKGYSKPCR